MLVNFAIVGSGVLALLIWKFGFGWDGLVQGPAGNRFEDVAEAIVGNLQTHPDKSPAEALAQAVPEDGARWMLFTVDGAQLAGPTTELPQALIKTARIGAPLGRRRDRRPALAPGLRPPPNPEQPERRMLGGPAPAELTAIGRFFVRTEDPTVFWVGVRIPVPRRERLGSQPGALIVRVEGAAAFARLLGVPHLVLLAAGAAAASVLLWLPFVGAVTCDLVRVHRATERIADGDFAARVVTPRTDEIGGVAKAVNRLAGRLQDYTGGQKRFLADVAHELGSPVACLQMLVGLLETRRLVGIQSTVDDVRVEVERMAELVDELLLFTKAELRPQEKALANVDLASSLLATIKREGAESRIELDLQPNLVVRADDTLLGRAVGNLVRNAMRYAVYAGPITIAARRDGPHVRIAVVDRGPGVPAEALGRLGEPFFRPEPARSRESGGAGLGLAIVVASIRTCGGEVRFANRHPQGFLAEITLSSADLAPAPASPRNGSVVEIQRGTPVELLSALKSADTTE